MTTLASERHCGVRVVCRFRPDADTAAAHGRASIAPASQLALDSRVEFLSEDTIQVHRSPAFPSASTSSFSLSSSKNSKERFTFDRVFWGYTATQNEVYEYTTKETVEDVLKGYNGTIFAYGQTGAGKSYTMFGPALGDPELRGIIPRACTQLFAHIAQDRNSGTEYIIKCSFLEIYKERVRDLLNPKNKRLKVRETPSRGVWVDNLTEEFVRSEEEVLELLQFGERLRSVAATDINVLSSRSHTLFTITVQQTLTDGSTKMGKLNLADLAGSEKVSKSGASGETLEEAKKINQSLSALGNCISALSKLPKGANPPSQAAAASKHIPYRDSKLTFILRESLGGNSKTTLVCACSPHSSNLEETVSTLRFGQRAKIIKNTVQVNEQYGPEELSAIIAKLKEEVAMLRSVMEPTYDPAAETVDVLELEKLRNSSNLRIEELKEEMKALENREKECIYMITQMKEELQQKDEIITRMTSEAAIAKASYLQELNQADRATKQLQLEIEQQAQESKAVSEHNISLQMHVKEEANKVAALQAEKRSLLKYKARLLCKNELTEERFQACRKTLKDLQLQLTDLLETTETLKCKKRQAKVARNEALHQLNTMKLQNNQLERKLKQEQKREREQERKRERERMRERDREQDREREREEEQERKREQERAHEREQEQIREQARQRQQEREQERERERENEREQERKREREEEREQERKRERERAQERDKELEREQKREQERRSEHQEVERLQQELKQMRLSLEALQRESREQVPEQLQPQPQPLSQEQDGQLQPRLFPSFQQSTSHDPITPCYFCPWCECSPQTPQNDQTAATNMVHQHVPQQDKRFMAEKRLIASGDAPDASIVCQDFATLTDKLTQYPVLFFCRYTHDPSKYDGLGRHYRVFVGGPHDKNLPALICSAWLQLAKERFFGADRTTISVWSNGQSKCFNVTLNLLFMSKLQEVHPEWKFIYNFFDSHHGKDSCAALTAIAGNAFRTLERDDECTHTHQLTMSTLECISLPRDGDCIHSTQQTLRYYKYLFPQAGEMLAFEASDDQAPKETLCRTEEEISSCFPFFYPSSTTDTLCPTE